MIVDNLNETRYNPIPKIFMKPVEMAEVSFF